MQAAKVPENEKQRLEDLKSYGILDTVDDRYYDNITSLAASICDTPISLVTFVDNSRQWFKSAHGLQVRETPRDYSFCAHSFNSPNKVFEINDAREDIRFHDNPLVIGPPDIVFYAGMPLVTEKGNPLGALCVIDKKPRGLSEEQKQALKLLSDQVLMLMKKDKQHSNLELQLEQRDSMIREVHHRVKNNFQVILSLLGLQASFVEDEKTKSLLRYIQYRINSQVMIHELLYNSENLQEIDFQYYVHQLVIGLVQSMKGNNHNIDVEFDIEEVYLNVDSAIPLGLIINELITNSLKYGLKHDNGKLYIKLEKLKHRNFLMKIEDNGPGFDKDITFRNTSSLGLQLVHSLILQLKGNIEKVNSGKGAKYIITFSEIGK